MSLATITPCHGSAGPSAVFRAGAHAGALAAPRWRWLRLGALLALALCAAAALVLALLLQALAPRPQAWNEHMRLELGGRSLEREVAMPVLLRLATHPLAARVVDGLRVTTSHGTWLLVARGGGHLGAVCVPCRVRTSVLASVPIDAERIELQLHALGADDYRASLTFGAAPQAFSIALRGRIDTAGHLQLRASLPATPLADVVAVLGRDLPERTRLQVDGELAFTLTGTWPGADWHVQPQLAGVTVSGLDTERLIERPRPAACRDGNDSAWPAYGGWLPRAAVAVLDPRYFEHAGYPVDAWTSSRANAGPTLSQRAARLALGRGDAVAAPTLRETLYAVEMERTLGKARLLDFYLAQAPWGEGLCGADRAVRVHLGQRDPNTVGPVAAAWLASLLPAPDERLGAQMAAGQVDRERVAGVIWAMRPMREARREKALADLPSWSPAALPPVDPAPSASEDATQTAAPTPPPIP